MTGKIIVIDLEATCWETNPPPGEINEIIEIGICVLDRATGAIENNRGILIQPEHSRVSPFCTQLTTITPELLEKEGISFEDALQILEKQYQSRQFTWASYGMYDKNMLQRQCAFRHLPYPMRHEHINVKELFRQVTGIPRKAGMNQALEILQYPLQGTHHRGRDDAFNIARILRYCLEKS